MTSEAEIVERLQLAEDADGGIACPVCGGQMGVMYTQHPEDHITRRRVCGRCCLRVTTIEKIMGGYDREDIQRARQKWAEWQLIHGSGEPSIAPIECRQLELFKDCN